MPIAALADEPWVAASGDNLIARTCRDAGFEMRLFTISRDPIANRALVAAGLAVTLVPRLLAAEFAGVELRPVAGAGPQRDVYVLLPPGGAAPARRRGVRGARRSSLRAGMNGRLLINCPDRHGIVAAVAGFLAASGANIISSDQHSTDPEGGEFFMRMEFTLERGDLGALGRAFQQEVAERLDMRYRLTDADEPKKMAVLVSKEDHCLVDLLWRHRRGELEAEIPLVASNHPDWAADVAGFGIPYHHVPFPNEPELLELLRRRRRGHPRALHADLERRVPREARRPGDQHPPLVPPGLRRREPLPARVRARREDHRARPRTTSRRNSTPGPIIEQDVARVSHREGAESMVRLGRDIERTVLARAVKWHLEDRVLVHGNRTVVF